MDARTGERRTLRTGDDGRHALAQGGPTADGDVVLLDHWNERWLGVVLAGSSHALAVLGKDGSFRDLWRRDGGGAFDPAVGRRIAVSPDGSRVAVVGPHAGRARSLGPLEVWDLRTGTGGPTGWTAIGGADGGFGWFPDGRRLAFGTTLPAGDPRLRGSAADAPDGFSASLMTDGRVACVVVADVETGEELACHPGATPVVASDGAAPLVRGGAPHPLFGDFDGGRPWRRIDVVTGEVSPVSCPGDWQGAIALLARDSGELVLYRGLPTAGGDPSWSEANSPFVGAKPLGTVKLADLRSGAFVTLLPGLDPRRVVSWSPHGFAAPVGER